MPAEEGYPAYLPLVFRLSTSARKFQNPVGQGGLHNRYRRRLPQGSDFSEPVTQNTKRFTRCFWALDKSLAYARHYPAINWMESYSEYDGDLANWYNSNVDQAFMKCRGELLAILREESSLMEIVSLSAPTFFPIIRS